MYIIEHPASRIFTAVAVNVFIIYTAAGVFSAVTMFLGHPASRIFTAVRCDSLASMLCLVFSTSCIEDSNCCAMCLVYPASRIFTAVQYV